MTKDDARLSDEVSTDAPDPPARPGRTRFLVLGLLSVTDGRETIVLQPSRPAALLAALLLHPGSFVASDFLQRVVWGAHPPAGGKSALHTCVLRLRKLLEKYDITDHTIEAVPGGYRLDTDADCLDLLQFRDLLARSSATDDPEESVRLARSALDLWQGPLLGNVPSDELHRDQVPRLTEERLLAVEQVFDGELRLGRHREMIAEARRAVADHPEHEGLSALLVEALYRSGRRGEALTEYRRIRRRLAEELGVEPGPALQELQGVVLRGEPLDDRSAPAPRTGGSKALPSAAGPQASQPPPTTGDGVLKALVDVGLLEEGPPGQYHVHDLLRLFAQAAGGLPPTVPGVPNARQAAEDAAPSVTD